MDEIELVGRKRDGKEDAAEEARRSKEPELPKRADADAVLLRERRKVVSVCRSSQLTEGSFERFVGLDVWSEPDAPFPGPREHPLAVGFEFGTIHNKRGGCDRVCCLHLSSVESLKNERRCLMIDD